jgi:son of sevenless-like protein
MSHEGNYTVYRRLVRNCTLPAIPYIGLFLSDITFIEDGNPEMIGSMINFTKKYKLAEVATLLQRCQHTNYSFKLDPNVELLFRNMPPTDDEKTYALSLRVEPRNANEALENLLMEEDKLRVELKTLQVRNADLEVSFSLRLNLL